jgi:hypothetical protein
MPLDFDPDYRAPYDQLCREFPDETVYPAKDFGIKWGPVFHRGRLDGTARVLAIGQVRALGRRFSGPQSLLLYPLPSKTESCIGHFKQ